MPETTLDQWNLLSNEEKYNIATNVVCPTLGVLGFEPDAMTMDYVNDFVLDPMERMLILMTNELYFDYQTATPEIKKEYGKRPVMGFMQTAMMFATQDLRQKTLLKDKFDDRIHFHDKYFRVNEFAIQTALIQSMEKNKEDEPKN